MGRVLLQTRLKHDKGRSTSRVRACSGQQWRQPCVSADRARCHWPHCVACPDRPDSRCMGMWAMPAGHLLGSKVSQLLQERCAVQLQLLHSLQVLLKCLPGTFHVRPTARVLQCLPLS